MFTPVIPLTPAVPTGPILTSERLRVGLEARGYRCTPLRLPQAHCVSPGFGVALQFGDAIDADGSDGPCLTVRSTITISGSLDRMRGGTGWQVRKTFRVTVGSEPFHLAIEADFILGTEIVLADALLQGGGVYRHLSMLIADASEALRDGKAGEKDPVVWIEARFFGDLASGRSGLLRTAREGRRSRPDPLAVCRSGLMLAACHQLREAVLPDLAGAVQCLALATATAPTGYGQEPRSGTRRPSGSHATAAHDVIDTTAVALPGRRAPP